MDKYKIISKKIILSGFSFMSLLILSIILLFYGHYSYGWFAKNTRVNANGMSVSANAKVLSSSYEYIEGEFITHEEIEGEDTTIAISGHKKPGVKNTVYVKYKNESEESVVVTEFGIPLPTSDDEVPIVVDGINYYFGSQMSVSVISYAVSDNPASSISSLDWTNLSDNSALLCSEDGELSKIDLFNTPTTVDSGSFIVFKVVFEFVNKDEDQNVYMNFGQEGYGGYCARKFFVTFE